MKTFDITWVIRKFIDIFPWLIIAIFTILWVYHAAIYLKDWCYQILSTVKLIDKKPMGGDFSHYWITARLALSGDPTAIYDPAQLQGAFETFFGVAFLPVWFYPPTFLLILLPLAGLSYSTALAIWVLISLGVYLWVIARIAPHPLSIFFALFFFATIQNVGSGQNGLLSAALLGGGLLLADESPISGGCLLGLLTYKPHLAILVPMAFIAGRHWKALIAMLATALGMILTSVMVLGYQVWGVFLTKNIPLTLKAIYTGKIIHGGSLPWEKMPTFFSAFNSAGIGLLPSVILQGIIMLASAALVFRVWHQGGSLMLRGSVLVLGTLLFTPYLFTYDLCLLALPLTWIAWDGYKTGWLSGEKYFLFLCWIMPMFSGVIAKRSGLQIAPVFLVLLVVLVCRRNNQRLGDGKLLSFRQVPR